MALDVFLIVVIAMTGGGVIDIAGLTISARTIQNPLLLLWLLGLRLAADEVAGRCSRPTPSVRTVLARRAGADDHRRDVRPRQPAAHRSGISSGVVGPLREPDVLLAQRASRCRCARAACRQSVSSVVRQRGEQRSTRLSVSTASKRSVGSASCPSSCCSRDGANGSMAKKRAGGRSCSSCSRCGRWVRS